MKIVQPIRDIEKLQKMKDYLKNRNKRDYFLFIMGTNTASRVNDILPMTVNDISSKYIKFYEHKTGKEKRFLINPTFRAEIDEYTRGMSPDALLFPSQKGDHIDRIQAWRILKEAANAVGLTEVGTHSMRKTFGYWHYKKYKDVALLQLLLNHSSPRETLIYIGISQDEVDESIKNFYI